ncbi:MAG: hypothetical protein COB76_03275 [Alphaproteobacteria bacterium]|nr:MAG: hypothetical protein COB76_03275 [Alphaproteobacteria bacterium]
MLKTSKFLLLTTLSAGALFMAAPMTAQASDDYDCDAHAAHIDHEIGAEKALEAYHVLHGDATDDHHIIDDLKKSHPDIEHELEEYTAKGCGEKELNAHANDH